MSRDQLPIEPLEEAAWRRVEKQVMTKLPTVVAPVGAPAPARRWFGAVALAVALIALVATLWPRDEAPPAIASTRVVTEAAPSVVRVGDATLRVGARSALIAVGSDAAGWQVVLSRGVVDCSVPPRGGRPPFVVLVDDVRVEVVGTRFTVQRDPELEVRVAHGVVRVTDGTEALLLRAGGRWGAEERPSARRVAPVVRSVPSDPGSDDPAFDDPVPSNPPQPTSQTESAADVPFDPQAEFSRASRLEASAPNRADAAYARVQRSGGPWAATALFARARLATERGRADRAGILLRRYLRRHPNGLNAADARRLLAAQESHR